MDLWKFYDITHRQHVVCNPTSEEKLGRLVELVQLPTNARVVDIACGKGEFLIRLAEAYGAGGVGVDISPFFIAAAERRLRMRAPEAEIAFTQMDVFLLFLGSDQVNWLILCMKAEKRGPFSALEGPFQG